MAEVKDKAISSYDFELNGETWTILEVPYIGDGLDLIGQTDYVAQTVKIRGDLKLAQKKKTLIHELTHVYLWSYGHNQSDKEFNNEDVCEIVACSYNFINKIVQNYFKEEK